MLVAKGITWSALVLAVVGCQTPGYSPAPGRPPAMSAFVKRDGAQLTLDGRPFRFIGVNNYYLHHKDDRMIDDVINNAAAMGVKVIRMWAFLDGKEEGDRTGYDMQPEKGVFRPRDGRKNAWERIDYTVKKAGEKGIRLILVLGNNWNPFGGVPQYIAWEPGAKKHDDFFTNEKIKQAYKDYAAQITGRTNAYTGVRYRDDPSIMAWELINEPRCESDRTGKTLLNWVTEMSRYMKSLVPRQLVAVGDEGFFVHQGASDWPYNGTSGVDFERIIAIDAIDFGTYHLYPDDWSEHWAADPAASGAKWIEDHLAAGKKAQKPVVLEEYGIKKNSPTNRDLVYETWNNMLFDGGGTGGMVWMLSGIDTGKQADPKTGLYPDYDGFRVVNDGGRTAELFQTFARLVNQGDDLRRPKIYLAAPHADQVVAQRITVEGRVLPYGQQVKEVIGKLDNGQKLTFSAQGDVYRASYDTTRETYARHRLTVEAQFADGSRASDDVSVMVDNRRKKLVLGFAFTFAKDLQGWQKEGNWQAEFRDPTPTFSKDLGKGAMKLDISMAGKADWEELRLKSPQIPELSKFVQLEYDTFIPAAGLAKCGIRPYAILNPGFTKIGLDQHNIDVSVLPKKTIRGKTYYVDSVKIRFGAMADKNELLLSVVGNMCALNGPVYINNIRLLREVPIKE